ncbi:hypothetical protein RRG08_004410, partial [Elysia crispata]
RGNVASADLASSVLQKGTVASEWISGENKPSHDVRGGAEVTGLREARGFVRDLRPQKVRVFYRECKVVGETCVAGWGGVILGCWCCCAILDAAPDLVPEGSSTPTYCPVHPSDRYIMGTWHRKSLWLSVPEGSSPPTYCPVHPSDRYIWVLGTENHCGCQCLREAARLHTAQYTHLTDIYGYLAQKITVAVSA